jgi:CBS domain containing-hemolysin-like protein
VAAEFALVKVRGSQIEVLIQQGNKKAILIKDILEHIDRYLSACQLGVTIASLAL